MNIGSLDRYITIQYPLESTSSTTGERTQTWLTLANVYATVTYPNSMASNEGLDQARPTSNVNVEFIIWFRTDINEKMRISYDSSYFGIERINKVGSRDEMLKIVTVKKY
jgi:SPP1 family predicted phage head-tail adaptor